jgi:hypothetical protein
MIERARAVVIGSKMICAADVKKYNLNTRGHIMTKSKEKTHKSQGLHPVECKLTDKQIAEAARILASAYGAQESLALEKKAAMGEFKQRADKLIEQIHVTSSMVAKGVEIRSVKCEKLINYTTNRATITRLDTRQVVEERELNAEEHQQLMQFASENKSPSSKEKEAGPKVLSMAGQVAKDEAEQDAGGDQSEDRA